MNDKIGPKERQVRELREQRDTSKKRRAPSPAELRDRIAEVKPAKKPNTRKRR